MHKKFDVYTRKCKRCSEFFKTPFPYGSICDVCNIKTFGVPPEVRKERLQKIKNATVQ